MEEAIEVRSPDFNFGEAVLMATQTYEAVPIAAARRHPEQRTCTTSKTNTLQTGKLPLEIERWGRSSIVLGLLSVLRRHCSWRCGHMKLYP